MNPTSITSKIGLPELDDELLELEEELLLELDEEDDDELLELDEELLLELDELLERGGFLQNPKSRNNQHTTFLMQYQMHRTLGLPVSTPLFPPGRPVASEELDA